ncbi:Low-affinity methionine permease [Escovopsis weberi]|uniref:Low-affinity methionine permease n=1 Tax=Escovopsis weberi TaxID=150374 RepID=A0A0M8MV16_ESCWE|nr:Low-affinity methionine permease [Escovopsis weberi]
MDERRRHEQSALLAQDAPSLAYSTLRRISQRRRPEASGSRLLEDQVLPETSPLGRTLAWPSAYVLTVSRVLGSGIFATPGSILRAVGSPGIAILVWLAGACVAACGLAYSLEFGCMLPRSGGWKVWLEFTYRRPRLLASVLVGMHAVLLTFTAPNCIVFGRYVVFALGVRDAAHAQRLARTLAIALLSLVTGMHAVRPRAAVRIQNTLGFLKLGIIALMLLSGVYAVLGLPQPSPSAPEPTPARPIAASAHQLSWDLLWKDSVWSWGVVAKALFEVSYAYSGLDTLTGVMNEVKDPVRTLRSVAVSALLTSCVIYTFINIAYFLVVPVDEIRNSGELIAALFFERVFGRIGRTVLPLVVALSAAGNVFVVTFTFARIKHEIARQGLLPFSQILSSTKPFGSPLGGLVLNYIPTLLVIALLPAGDMYTFILHLESYIGQVVMLAIGVGLLWLRWERPDIRRPFRAWLPAVAVRILMSISLLLAPFFPSKEERSAGGMFYAAYAIVGMGAILIGLAYWYVWSVLLPRLGGYRLDERAVVLEDGTTITEFVHKYE